MPQARDEAGNIWEIDAQGNPVRLLQAAPQQAAPLAPPDPVRMQREVAQTNSAQANAAVDQATVNAQIALAQAQADKARAEANAAIANQNGGGGLTDAQKQVDAEFAKMYAEMQASGGIADIRKQVQQLRDALVTLENSDTISGPTIGRLPEFIQQAINPDAVNVREQIEEVVQRNLRLILGAQFTQAEGEKLIARAFNPRLQEATNADRLARLIEQMDTALNNRESSIRYYEKNGTIAGWTPDTQDQTSAFDVIRTDGGVGQERAPAEAGSTTESLAAPPQMVREHDRMVAALASQNGGRIDPDRYAAERARLDAKYNRQGNIEDYKGWATSVNDYLDAGGRTIPTGIQDETRVMSMTDTLRNNLVSNPVGAAATGYFNAGGMGALNALAPDQAAALADAYPLSSLGGEIGGAITGTALLGGLARNTVGRAAPRLLGGGARSQTARNIGTDAAYAAGYSANSGDDIATGTALGVGGSAFGQALGKLTGAAVGGLQRTAPAQALIDRGVRLSIGRQLGGGAARAEDALQSIPFVGSQIRGRLNDSFADFNQAAFREAAAPIGYTPQNVGQQGLTELLGDRAAKTQGAIGRAYDDAVAGQVFPIDDTFNQQIDAAFDAAGNLPDDLAVRAERALQNRVEPLRDGRTVYRLQEPSTLATPLNPTPEQMRRFAQVQDVPLAQVRSDQSQMNWNANARGQFNEPLIDGFGDRPLAVRLNNDEFLIRDGNHRTVRAFNAGRETEPMYVVNASDIDPQNAGPRPSAAGLSIDELAAELGPIDFAAAPYSARRTFSGREAITGEQYQQARRGLKSYRAETTKPGFEEDYRNVLGQGISALDGLVTRQAGPDVVANLGRADEAYRNAKTLERAANSGAGGSQTDEIFNFTPNQLQRAGLDAQRRYPGPRPFAELADQGQQVLPSKLPNSGTADRLMAASLLPGSAALGLGGGFAVGQDPESAFTGAGLATALALLGTRQGQQLVQRALIDRPEGMRRAGRAITARRGLFGSAMLPVVAQD